MAKAKAPAAKVTFQAKAYLGSYARIEDVIAGKSMPHITQGGDYFEGEGYPLIGTVEVTITLNSNDKVVQNQIGALQKKLETQRAEAYRAEQAILTQISKLQALTFEGSVVEAA